jgi:hypothetical protein
MRNFRRLLIVILGLGITLVGCELMRTPEECEADLEEMHAEVDAAVSSGIACQRDTDCVLFNPTNNCYGACPVAVNANEMPRIEQDVLRADAELCRNFAEQCGYSTPSCPTLEPVCQQGQCVLIDRTEGP